MKRMYIKCRTCLRRSFHPEDIRNLFCGYCHKFHQSTNEYTFGEEE